MFLIFISPKKSNNPNCSGCLRQRLEAFVFPIYPKCWSCLTHINLLCKDHKSSDNLLYLSNLFSVKHIKQIMVKHSIKKGRAWRKCFHCSMCCVFWSSWWNTDVSKYPQGWLVMIRLIPGSSLKHCPSILSIKIYCSLLLNEFKWIFNQKID